MSWFIKFLECILCFEDEGREVSRNRRQYEYQRLPSADPYSRTTLTHSPLRSQSNFPQTSTSSKIQNECLEKSVNSPSILNRESIRSNSVPSRNVVVKSCTSAMDPGNVVPIVSSQYALPSSVKPPSAIAKANLSSISEKNSVNSRSILNRESVQSSSVPSRNVVVKSCTSVTDPGNKVPVVSSQFAFPSSATPPSASTKANLSSISEKSGLKPNDILSSSSSADVLQAIKVNQTIKKQSSPNNVISASSQISQRSSDLPSYVHSLKPPAIATKPTPSSVSENSSEFAWKSKDLPLLSSNGNVRKSSTFDRATDKETDHKLCCDAFSASSKLLLSSLKFPLFPGSPELLSPLSDTEKRSSTLKKNPQSPSTLPVQSQSPKPPPLSTKPTLSPVLTSSTSQKKNANYVWLEKSASTTYVFPNEIKSLIEKDILPGVLKMPVSPSTYKDYFHALLYAEDCHLEKWEGFEMKNVTLELHDATIYTRKGNSKSYKDAVDKDEKVFVAFDIDKILERQTAFEIDKKRERRPFLLSRDFISVKPTGRKIKPFQGVIYRVVKSSLVLAEFGEHFHSQHDPECEYDVKFSFNRVCLKRAHHAITAAPDTLYRNFLFPDIVPKQELPSTDLFVNHKYQKEAFAVRQILRLQGAPPCLVEGPISVVAWEHLSRTGMVIVEAVLRICRNSPSNRVLLCAPLNNTCDVLMRALKKEMKESDLFRANAAFREIDGVPVDILPSCLYESDVDCFACPPLEELKKYKVISSTFMSSFRLRDEGMVAGHFSHIFLVDASSVTEPEAMVPLANLTNSKTIVVVTGAPRNHSGWVRSKIARQYGLMTSYFERLRESELYKNLDPRVITQLEDRPQNWNESSKSLSLFLDLI